MPDKPVHPLTLYRLTLETNDEDTFLFWRDILIDEPNRAMIRFRKVADWILESRIERLIGVESRIRERLKR